MEVVLCTRPRSASARLNTGTRRAGTRFARGAIKPQREGEPALVEARFGGGERAGPRGWGRVELVRSVRRITVDGPVLKIYLAVHVRAETSPQSRLPAGRHPD